MYEEMIKRIEADIRSWEELMKSQNEKMATTREILNEFQTGLSSSSAVAKASGIPVSSEERQLYLSDIKRCNEDLAAMYEAGTEMQRSRDKLKVNLEKLQKRNA